MKNKTFDIIGMHCAGCAQNITKAIEKVAGVKSVKVTYATDKAAIEFDNNVIDWAEIKKVVKEVGGYEIVLGDRIQKIDHGKVEKRHNHAKDLKEEQISGLKNKAIVSGFLALVILVGMLSGLFPNEITFVLTSVVLAYSGREFFENAWSGLKNLSANMDTLIAIGTGTAYLYSTVVTFMPTFFSETPPVYYDTAAAIVALIILGRYLEARAKGKASEAIKKLLQLQVKKATVLKKGREIEINLEDVQVGNRIIVKPGEKAPVDGIVLKGVSYLNESLITGESKPVKKTIGDKVIGSTMNSKGTLIIKATRVGDNTILAQIVKMVQEAQSSRAPIQKLADKISSVFVPVVIIVALLSFIFWFFIAGIEFTSAMLFFITVLIISCPCALGLATPIAIVVGTGKGARKGILIKNSEKLQVAGNINTVIFDKTGTLTKGKFEVTNIISINPRLKSERRKILRIVASLEKGSEHPIGEAIVREAKKNRIRLYSIEDFRAVEGKGIRGLVDSKKALIGSKDYIRENNQISNTHLDYKITQLKKEGKTIAYVAVDGKVIGAIALADEPKEKSKETVKWLKSNNIEAHMVTGDNKETARIIGKRIGIGNILAEILPEDKVKVVADLQKISSRTSYINPDSAVINRIVAFVGDGINDAPALAQADVGIAMATGTDVAIEAGDITLMRGKIELVKESIILSKQTMRTIKQNLFWAFSYNIILIPVAAGLLVPINITISPILASGAMAFSSLSVVLNSLRLKSSKLE